MSVQFNKTDKGDKKTTIIAVGNRNDFTCAVEGDLVNALSMSLDIAVDMVNKLGSDVEGLITFIRLAYGESKDKKEDQ